MMRHTVYMISAGLLLAFVLLLLSSLFIPRSTVSVEAHVRVDDYVGINLDTDKLYFGTVAPGGQGRRSASVGSPNDAFVIVTTDGPAGKWITPVNRTFFVDGGEVVSVPFVINVPRGTDVNNYTGKVRFSLYHPIVGHFVQ